MAKVNNAEVEATKQIYEIARQEANQEIARLKGDMEAGKADGFALGFLEANKYHRASCEFTDALMLYRVKKTKDYKKAGYTWDGFCEAAGIERRTADRIVEDIAPIVGTFSDKLSVFSGLGLNEIRYLGKSNFGQLSVSEDGNSLVIDGENVPATPAEILAYVNRQKEAHRAELTEKDETVKAKEKVLADKQKLLNKYSKDLAKLEGKAKQKELTPEEDGFLKKVDFFRTGFDGYLLQLDPDRIEELSFEADPAPTPRMRAAYLAALDYMKKQILVAYDKATEMYGNAIMCPEAAWKPGMGAALTAVEPAGQASVGDERQS
ncbi:MAG: hypothetical protein LLG97_19500 [Deltaproteobacteria bacterium]|nr:hypothetical protein [Deltaproteobacteria bacterium]